MTGLLAACGGGDTDTDDASLVDCDGEACADAGDTGEVVVPDGGEADADASEADADTDTETDADTGEDPSTDPAECACDEGEVCDDSGTCVPVGDVCEPGATRCLNELLLTCDARGEAETVTECGDDEVCYASDDGASCAASECEAGEVACEGNVPRACDADGFWVDGEACGELEVCEAGECVALACPAGELGCADAWTPYYCDDDNAEVLEEPCAAGEICEAGACVPEPCEAGTEACDGGVRLTCSLDGAWVAIEDCGDGVCHTLSDTETECAESCAADGAYCDRTAIMRCGADGQPELVEECAESGQVCAPGDGEPSCVEPLVVDILFSVETHEGMREEMAPLEAGLQHLAATLEAAGADYRLIVLAGEDDVSGVDFCAAAPLDTSDGCEAESGPHYLRLHQHVAAEQSLLEVFALEDERWMVDGRDAVRHNVFIANGDVDYPYVGWTYVLDGQVHGIIPPFVDEGAASGIPLTELRTCEGPYGESAPAHGAMGSSIALDRGVHGDICAADWTPFFDDLADMVLTTTD